MRPWPALGCSTKGAEEGGEEKFVITVASQNDICHHDTAHPMNDVHMVRKRITTTGHARTSRYVPCVSNVTKSESVISAYDN